MFRRSTQTWPAGGPPVRSWMVAVAVAKAGTRLEAGGRAPDWRSTEEEQPEASFKDRLALPESARSN